MDTCPLKIFFKPSLPPPFGPIPIFEENHLKSNIRNQNFQKIASPLSFKTPVLNRNEPKFLYRQFVFLLINSKLLNCLLI